MNGASLDVISARAAMYSLGALCLALSLATGLALLWLIDMVGRDPALIVSLGTRSHSRSIGTQDRDLVIGINVLRRAARLLGSLTALAAALLLREQCRDPRAIDEVDGTHEAGEEEEIQEDAVATEVSMVLRTTGRWMGKNSHLGIEYTGIRLDDTDCLIEGQNRVRHTTGVRDNRGQVQCQILWDHFGREEVAEAVLATSGDLEIEALRRQVSYDLRSSLVLVAPQAAADKDDLDGIVLVVGEI